MFKRGNESAEHSYFANAREEQAALGPLQKVCVFPSLPAAVNVNDEAVESAVMMPLRIKCASASSSEATGVPAGATTEVGVAESAWQNVVTSSNERNTSGPPHPSSGVSFVTSTSSSRMATLQTVPSRSRKRDAQQRRLAAPLTYIYLQGCCDRGTRPSRRNYRLRRAAIGWVVAR